MHRLNTTHDAARPYSLSIWPVDFVCGGDALHTPKIANCLGLLGTFKFALIGLPLHSFPGGSGAPPTCKWLKSCSVCLSSSLIPRVKFGSLNRRFLADSGIFCSTPSFC